MRSLRLIGTFIRASAQEEIAYRANFFISMLHSLLNLSTGILGLTVLFGQIQTVHGWNFTSMLALLAVYLILGALRGLFIGPSLEALAGIDGEVWTGRFDFTLLRPVDVQFLASFRKWRLLSLLDLALGLAVLIVAAFRLSGDATIHALSPVRLAVFLLSLGIALSILYSILLAFTGLVFWSRGLLFTWVFDGLFQMARYPVGLYPGWLRLALTWVIPVGIMTTVPAQVLTGDLSAGMLAGSVALAIALLVVASLLFRSGVRNYASASS